jgi:methyl coenzyme M reductase gamma subunit
VGEYGFNGDDPLEKAAAQYSHEVRDLQPGRPAPDIVGEDVYGHALRLSDYGFIRFKNLREKALEEAVAVLLNEDAKQ